MAGDVKDYVIANGWDEVPEGGKIHVYPLCDMLDHDTKNGELCACLPITIQVGRGTVIRHNSFDGREFVAVIRHALDEMGAALGEHHHKWSPALRQAYEHAQHLLAFHWPEDYTLPDAKDEHGPT